MHCVLRLSCLPALALAALLLPTQSVRGVMRDGGVDPANLGKGEWIASMADATNRLGGHVSSVTNENSLMLYYKSRGIRHVIVKTATNADLYKDCYGTPQFTSNLVNFAHAHGLFIFGYNRSYGADVVAEIGISDYVFLQGADGFVWDAESEWEAGSSHPWITNAPAQAWWLCSTVRSNWPTKFLAHAPFPIISWHTPFPYKEFGYWCDAVMPQIYYYGWTGVKRSPSGGINWSDANWASWQNSLVGSNSVVNGQMIYWTNAIKPLAPVNNVYGEQIKGGAPCFGNSVANMSDRNVMEFIDYLSCDPNCVIAGGYQGANFFRTALHGTNQWARIGAGTIGMFSGVINNIVMDDPQASLSGSWTAVRTFSDGAFYGNGSGTDTNSFGTNYFCIGQGTGTNYIQFTPNIVVPGDYNVYQWHPFRADASAGTPHIITYNGDSTTIYANQRTNDGNWSLLGQFNFAAGTEGSIRVTDGIAEPDAVALVDGIKLVFVASNPPPSGPVSAWGDNCWAQIEVPSLTNVSAIAAGAYHNLALRHDGTVVAWGDNWLGQCAVPTGLADVVAIAAGAYHNLALKADGTVVAWGENDYGQTNVPTGLQQVVAIAAGTYHNLALCRDGRVVAWGYDNLGQCRVPANLSEAVAIAAGGNHSLALRADGRVAAWGENTDPFGNFAGQSVVPQHLANVLGLGAGDYHSLAVKADGSVVAWGDNSDGQCDVPSGLTNVVAVAAGGAHSLALRANGTLVAWGANGSGQCNPPVLRDVVSLGAGTYHSVALVGGSLPAPRLLSPIWEGNQFSVLAQTLYRKNYTLEYKDFLAPTTWSVLSTNSGNGGLKLLSDPSAKGAQRFYRLRGW